MDKTADYIENPSSKKQFTGKLTKPSKNSKSFLSRDPGKPSTKAKPVKKSLQKPEITPLKTRPSTYKENSTTKDSESFAKVYKNKLSRQSTIKKKPLKLTIPKTRPNRGKSLGETKKNTLKDQRSTSKPTLKPQVSASALKVLDMNKKLTPRSSHPSPQHSHRTPDSIRISQGQNLPNLTEKKSKIPEVGYYCKRFSLFDKNKPLYKDTVDLTTEKQDFPKLSFDSPFNFQSEPSVITKTVSDNSVCTPIKEKPNEESFESPTRLIKVYSSPEGKMIKRTSESPKRGLEPRAPRKTIADFDSPGSFIFSVSSNSSDDHLIHDFSQNEKRGRFTLNPQKDEESQTDLIEFVSDTHVLEGLKLIGQLSEIMHKTAPNQ